MNEIRQTLKATASLIVLILCFNVNAAKVTSVGTHKYSFFKQSEARGEALSNAKEAAFKKYIAKYPSAKQSMIQEHYTQFIDEIDQIVSNTSIQQEKNDKKKDIYKVAIIADINPTVIDIILDKIVSSNASSFGPSDFGALFIARVELSRKEFDAKRTSISESDSRASIEEISASDGQTSLDVSNSKSLNINTTGGNTTRKRDKVVYEPSIEISEEVAYAVEEQLINVGFEPMDIMELEDYGVPLLDEITGQMRKSGRLPSRVTKEYQKAAIDAGWSLLGMGTIDIGTPQQDNQRGTVKVPATVSFKVWSLVDGRARTVASVRPQVVYGQDSGDSSAAETEAYNAAVELALETVIAQLQKKGIR